MLRGHPRAERPCVTGRKRKASRQINRLRVLKDFSFFPFVYLNFISHSIWVTCAYNRGLYKRRKVWTPSLQGIESYCFTATFVGQQGTKISGAASVVPLGSAVGRTVSPANSRADALAPGPQKATLFGEGGAEEVAREAGMSRTGAGWPLSRRDGCFVEEGTWTQRTRCEAWGIWKQRREWPGVGMRDPGGRGLTWLVTVGSFLCPRTAPGT